MTARWPCKERNGAGECGEGFVLSPGPGKGAREREVGGGNHRLFSDIPAEPGAPRVGFRALFALLMRSAGTRSAARTPGRAEGRACGERRGAGLRERCRGLFALCGGRFLPAPEPPPPAAAAPAPLPLRPGTPVPPHKGVPPPARLRTPGAGPRLRGPPIDLPPSPSPPRRPLAARLNKRQERR